MLVGEKSEGTKNIGYLTPQENQFHAEIFTTGNSNTTHGL